MSEETLKTAEPEIALTQYVDPATARADVEIDLEDLTGCMVRHPGLFTHYSGLAVRAKTQADRMKSRLELIEAALDRKHRENLKAGNPKTTEPQIKSAVQTDKRYLAANKLVLDAVQQARFADSIVEAFHQRKDMLLQIARDAAREQGARLQVLGANASRQAFLEAAGKGASAVAQQ